MLNRYAGRLVPAVADTGTSTMPCRRRLHARGELARPAEVGIGDSLPVRPALRLTHRGALRANLLFKPLVPSTLLQHPDTRPPAAPTQRPRL